MKEWSLAIGAVLVAVAIVIGIAGWWSRGWRGWREALIIVAAIVALVAVVAPAGLLVHAFRGNDRESILAECIEPPTRRAAVVPARPRRGVPPNIELESNRARPTLTNALADQQSALDSITFASKDRRRVPDLPMAKRPKGKRIGASTGAVFLETPRRAPPEPIDSKVRAKAEPIAGATAVRLTVCVDRGELLKAGSFQGTVRIFGPRVNDFDYAVVITQKWPWETALAVLWYAGLAFIAAALLTGSLTFDPARSGVDRWLASAAGAAFAVFAMAPAFFGAYWNNPTWGADPGAHVIGLATAGFTAALAGLVAAQKFFQKPTGKGGADTTEA